MERIDKKGIITSDQLLFNGYFKTFQQLQTEFSSPAMPKWMLKNVLLAQYKPDALANSKIADMLLIPKNFILESKPTFFYQKLKGKVWNIYRNFQEALKVISRIGNSSSFQPKHLCFKNY